MSKKHKHEEHVNHERWLVSYADFITLLFATFVALYAMSKADTTKFEAAAASLRMSFGSGSTNMIPQQSLEFIQIPSDRPTLVSSKSGSTDGEDQKQAGSEDFHRIKRLLENFLMTKGMLSRVNIEIESRGLVISLKEAGFFESGRAELKKEGQEVFEELALYFKEYRNPIRVEGHSDNVPIRSALFPSNWELSTTRATNVVKLLVREYGIDAQKISATGYGEFRPVSDNDSEGGRARNRRVDLVILSGSGEIGEPQYSDKR